MNEGDTTAHGLQVLNMLTALAEICDTQAAMNLLGYEAEVSSHGFKYLHAWPAVGYQNTLTFDKTDEPSNKTVESADADLSNVNVNNNASVHSNEDSDNADNTENQEHEADFCCDQIGNKRTVYISKDGEAHAMSQCQLYRHRVANWDEKNSDPGCTDGKIARLFRKPQKWKDQASIEQQCGLKDFSLLQFVMHVTVKKLPPGGKLSDKNMRAFRLNSECPLHQSHYLQLNKKDKIPILAGKTRPCPPSHKKPTAGVARRRWEARANRFARYMGAILFAWDRHGDCGVHNWDQLQHKVCELKRSHHKRDNHANKDLYCDAFHLQYLNQVATNLRSSEEVQKTSHAWGSEFAHRFSRGSIQSFSSDVNERDHHVQLATTINEIQELVNQATAAQAIAATSTDAAKAKRFLSDMNDDMDKLYSDSDGKMGMCDVNNNARNENTHWSRTTREYNKQWVDNRRTELNKDVTTSEPIRDPNPLGSPRHLQPSAIQKLKKIRKRLGVNDDWVRTFDHVTKTWFSGEQLLLFIHGGAGTGKTTLAKAIIQAATIFNLEHRFSATSGVAGLLNNGTTIHHLLAQQGELTGAKPNVNKIRLRNGNARVILIDEVSCRVLINVSDDICGCIFQQR
jgi:hypothetical protein